MRKLLNSKGITLIEVLATLTLMTIVGGLICGILINSLNIFNHESDKSDIRQEANIIINQLTTFYKINGNFEVIHNSDGSINISSDKEDGTKESRDYGIPSYEIKVDSFIGDSSENYESKDVEIIITEKNDPNNIFTLESNISRIKD